MLNQQCFKISFKVAEYAGKAMVFRRPFLPTVFTDFNTNTICRKAIQEK